ncbi:NADH-quinone oxidoreductase subunit M [Polynucleobacter difficilis]|uniref:NADH-quinone oxidoreductase subunit M n=1 Tax=Polynucleobacter difficilis TaxID=556054 RepID=UPI000D36C9C2|nr:NADH-quinone oxidoreductase subunit M [Polynucleobacter difficilis]
MILSYAIWIPIVFGLIILIYGSERPSSGVRYLALFGAVLGFIATLPLVLRFDETTAGMQFVEKFSWIERYDINYHLGVDGISVWFVVLTAFINIFVVVAAWEVITEKVSQYLASFMILSGLMIGVFSALDGMLFYVFFEATLIPMYIIIGVWGGKNRIYAAFKFFLYTLLGSLLTLIAMLYLYNATNTFDIQTWHHAPLDIVEQILIFFAFFMAFAVKVPMWPLHTWLPDVHVEAPTGGSVVLAAIMLKLGAYGFLRFSLPIAPDASMYLGPFVIFLSLVAVIYVGLVALVQKDMKKLVAYSSVAHMGFVTLGFFLFSPLGIEGGIIQMISHGFISGAMFLAIGVLYDRMHTRQIADFGGVIHRMPKFSVFMVFMAMANCGLPATSGFVGEFMVILAAVDYDFWIGLLAATALLLGAAYSLWMVKRVLFGAIANKEVDALTDINGREFLMMAVLSICVLWMGIYPKPFTDIIHPAVMHLLEHVAISKL